MANLEKALKIAGCAALEIIILVAEKFRNGNRDNKASKDSKDSKG